MARHFPSPTSPTSSSSARVVPWDKAFDHAQCSLPTLQTSRDLANLKATVVLMTFARGAHDTALFNIRHFLRWQHLHEVIVAWNSGLSDLKQFTRHLQQLTAAQWQRVRIVVFDANKQTNRYDSRTMGLTTDAVFYVDDDRTLPLTLATELLAFWARHPDRLVGMLPRGFRSVASPNSAVYHRRTGLAFEYFTPARIPSIPTGEVPIMLPGAGAIVHRSFLCVISSPIFAPLRTFVDKQPCHPDDLLLHLAVMWLNGAKLPLRFHVQNATSPFFYKARIAAEQQYITSALAVATQEVYGGAAAGNAGNAAAAGDENTTRPPHNSKPAPWSTPDPQDQWWFFNVTSPAKVQLHSNDPWWFLLRSHGLSWIAEYLNLTTTLQLHSSPLESSPKSVRQACALFQVPMPYYVRSDNML